MARLYSDCTVLTNNHTWLFF